MTCRSSLCVVRLRLPSVLLKASASALLRDAGRRRSQGVFAELSSHGAGTCEDSAAASIFLEPLCSPPAGFKVFLFVAGIERDSP